jgi:glycosyltransferase involved in cell wall biosynthesis
MGRTIAASVVINNRNYGRFLSDAIESALAQSYPHTEVIVVDDGSEDHSRQVIAHYAGQVTSVFKENGGQGSAFNAGLAASAGAVILFLDADDMLLPTAVEQAVAALENPDVVKVHWRLRVVDENGKATGQLRPGGTLPQGDLREAAFRLGPTNHLSAPTSGNGWSRRYLERIFPVPDLFRQGADTYLFELAPFFGPIGRIEEPQSLYRKHGSNFHAKMTMEYKLQRQTAFYDVCVAKLQACFEGAERQIDPDLWRRNSWWHRHALAVAEITALPKPERALILVDEATWEAGPIGGRQRLPFLEKDGHYYGTPPDDETAICELERLRQTGAAFLVFAWPAFWWFDHFRQFYSYLRASYPCVLENERLVVFEL